MGIVIQFGPLAFFLLHRNLISSGCILSLSTFSNQQLELGWVRAHVLLASSSLSMAPAKASSLPIIDIGPFLNSDSNNVDLRASTAAALHNACIEYGFFYLDISAYVDPSVPEHLTQLGRTFFSLPQEEKNEIALKNQDGARGTFIIPATALLLTGP